MKLRTIKAKITFWFSVLFLILVIGVMIFSYFVGHSTVQKNTKQKLRSLVEANIEELEYMYPGEDLGDDEGDYFIEWRGGFLEIDDDFRKNYNGVSIALYDGNDFLYGEDPIGAAPSAYPFDDSGIRSVKYGGDVYYLYDTEVHGERLDGLWLRGVISDQEDVPILLRVTRMMLLALPILALIAIYGGYLIAGRTLQPLSDISEQANSISSGSDLSRRIRIDHESAETAQLVDTFNGMFERLHASFEAEKQFTSDASHELRTPVAVILAECEYALDEENPAEWREALEVVSRQGMKMSGMIEELLTFTRIERGIIPINLEDLFLDDLAREVCREQERIQKKDIRMHLELDEHIAVRADRGLLERLIRNLVSNAYQYGREPGNIRVKVYSRDERKILEVSDDGIGIRAEELPNIWNRFYRADNARKDRESTGLGLSMVRQIALLHHAEAKVFSEFGKGSTFLIIF